MIRCAFILLSMVPFHLHGQDTIPKIELVNLPFKNLPESVSTVNNKGESLILISAVEIKIHAPRCYDKGFKVNLPVLNKSEIIQPAWYRWNPSGRFWQEESKPMLMNNLFSGKPGYSVIVTCPGIYAFLEKPKCDEKGIIIESSLKMPIKSVRIRQEEPNLIVNQSYKEAQEKVRIKTSDLFYHAEITIIYEANNKEIEIKNLAGALFQLDTAPDKDGYRKIKLKQIIAQKSVNKLK
jgi:hypothetical protein